MPGELIKNTIVYVVVSSLAKGLAFLIWIVLARWLAPSQIGIYALALFVIEFFSAINIFGLDSVIMRFYYHKDRVSVLSSVSIIFLLSSLIVLPLFIFTAKWIPIFITGLLDLLKENLFLFWAIIFTTSIANIAFVHYATLKKVDLYAKLQLLKILLLCSFALILVYLGFAIRGVLFAHLFSTLSVAILFIMKERKGISIRFVSPRVLKNIINYGFPLMLKVALGVLVLYFGRLLLGRYTNLTILGVYSFFLMLTLQINKLWSSFNLAWTPKIFSEFSEDRKKTIENIKFMAFLFSFLYLSAIALFIILGKLFLFNLIFKEIYLSNIHLFYILLLAPLFSGIYTVAYPLYYYEQKTRRILFISLGLSLVTIFLTFFMVKSFDQNGAALSVFILAIFGTVAYLLTFKKIMKIPSKILNWTFILSILMTLNVVIFLKTSSHILFLAFIILGAILAYKIGRLTEKKYLFYSFFKKIGGKI